jgi:hypothetical protein
MQTFMDAEIRKEINEYLYFEIGIDGEESQVSETWPFELDYVGQLAEGDIVEIYKFSYEGETYFAQGGRVFDFYPTTDMKLEHLRLLQKGARWIGEDSPVDLDTVSIGDERVPTLQVRQAAIMDLATQALGDRQGIRIRILEGLFLKTNGMYLALVAEETTGWTVAVGTGLRPYSVGFPDATPWRRLSVAVGEMLEHDSLPGASAT